MNLKTQNVMFLLRATQHGGTENVVLQLCKIFKSKVNKIVVCSADGFRTGLLTDMGIRHYVIKDLENKSLSAMISIIKDINMVIGKEKITVIHTHHRMATLYANILRLFHGFKIISTAHNTFEDKKLLTKIAYHNVEIAACGQMVRNNLVDYFGISNERVRVIHNAVEPFSDKVVPCQEIEELHRAGHFVIGNIGRLSEQKGMGYYIQAASIVLKKNDNVKFVIVGSGEEESKLRTLVSSLQLEKYITFLGYRNDPQNLMSQMDLIVLSSLWEGLPLTPIEAFSVGKTIVATAVDGTTEIVEDGKSGLLVKPKDAKEIAEEIIWMIEHPKESSKMENSALKRYKDEFTFEKLSEEYMELYKEMIC